MAVNFETRRSELRGTAEAWATENPVLLAGEWGIEIDTNKAKIGDGATAWNSLPYFGGSTQTLQQVTDEGATTDVQSTFESGIIIGGGSTASLFLNDGTVRAISTTGGNLGVGSFNQVGITANELLLNGLDVQHIQTTGLNATTNNLGLADGDGELDGYEVIVTTAGTIDFGSGNIDLAVGDVLGKLNGTYYKKVDNNQSGGSGDLLAANNLSDLDNADTAISNLGITATATELNYADGVTSNIQAQLDAKGQVDSVVAGTNIAIDNTDPQNPVISASGTITTISAWNGEFNRQDFEFDTTTGILNQIGTGNTVFVSQYNDTFVNGGANYRITDFNCYQDATNVINVVYGDFNASGTVTMASSSVDNLPAVPTGRVRLILGVCEKKGDNDFVFRSKYFGFPKQVVKYYPFEENVIGRDGDLQKVIDIKSVKLKINSPDDLYHNGRLIRIAPNFITNGGLMRWSKYDREGNSLGFISTSNISLQSGVATVTLPETAESGVVMSITMDFDLMDGTTQYSFGSFANWYFDDQVLLEAIDEWQQIQNIDYYTNTSILPSLAKLKLNDGTDTTISCFGNSMTTYLIGGSDNENPENLPPSCQTKYVPYNLWNDIVKNKPVYDRYDSTVNAFTESGTFANTEPFSGSTADKRGGELMRFSSTNDAYVEWDWDLSAYENLNFIFATDDGNSNDLTITVSTGNGEVECYDIDTTSWVEANNQTFDQIANAANTATGDLGWTLNDRLKLRRVATSGTVTIRIAKGTNSDVLYYWGTERYNGATTFINNEGYTANNLGQLEFKYNSSLFSKYKDTNIIIFELPLINESASNLTDLRNSYQDFIWGDRVGNLNPNSLKNLSSDWVDFQVLIYLPQMPNNNYDINGGYSSTGITAVTKWNTLIDLLEEKGDLPYIDGRQLVSRMESLRGVTAYELTTGNSSNKKDYYTTSYDDIHTNDLGSKNVSKIISPNFN